MKLLNTKKITGKKKKATNKADGKKKILARIYTPGRMLMFPDHRHGGQGCP